VVEPEPSERADWQIILELIEGLGGGPTGNRLLDGLLRMAKPLGLRWEPTLVADLILRSGPFGDGFLPWSAGLNMSKLKNSPHGIDLGPMPPGFTHRLFHDDKRIDLIPSVIERAFSELRTALDQKADHSGLLLIGRRELRTNNSWMHNAPSLVSGRERCLLYVHPQDAERVGLKDGAAALLTSRIHQGRVSIRVTDEMRPGVVSLPHGWGHEASAAWQRVAGAHAGVSVNDWTDDAVVEPIIGQSIFNGVPVSLAPIA
jgi:anaerobic selenocysteine-containing dehydrogenase